MIEAKFPIAASDAHDLASSPFTRRKRRFASGARSHARGQLFLDFRGWCRMSKWLGGYHTEPVTT